MSFESQVWKNASEKSLKFLLMCLRSLSSNPRSVSRDHAKFKRLRWVANDLNRFLAFVCYICVSLYKSLKELTSILKNSLYFFGFLWKFEFIPGTTLPTKNIEAAEVVFSWSTYFFNFSYIWPSDDLEFGVIKTHWPWIRTQWPQTRNTWANKSRDWHIDGVANKSSVWFFMSTNLQKIPVKISWHFDVWSTSFSDLSDASLDILKTMHSKQFRVLIYHCFLMKKYTVQAQQWLEKCYGDSAPSKTTICR